MAMTWAIFLAVLVSFKIKIHFKDKFIAYCGSGQ
jgi:hypothetical protein